MPSEPADTVSGRVTAARAAGSRRPSPERCAQGVSGPRGRLRVRPLVPTRRGVRLFPRQALCTLAGRDAASRPVTAVRGRVCFLPARLRFPGDAGSERLLTCPPTSGTFPFVKCLFGSLVHFFSWVPYLFLIYL